MKTFEEILYYITRCQVEDTNNCENVCPYFSYCYYFFTGDEATLLNDLSNIQKFLSE